MYHKFEIELLAPISESIFSNFLRENGPGIHHIAIESGRSFSEMLKMVRDKGEKPFMHLQKGDGKDILAYLDLKKGIGFCVEIFGEEAHGSVLRLDASTRFVGAQLNGHEGKPPFI